MTMGLGKRATFRVALQFESPRFIVTGVQRAQSHTFGDEGSGSDVGIDPDTELPACSELVLCRQQLNWVLSLKSAHPFPRSLVPSGHTLRSPVLCLIRGIPG